MNLTELSSRVALRLGRDDQSGNIPAWLNLALKRINNQYVFRQWRTKLEIPVTGVLTYQIPVDCRKVFSLRYTDLATVNKQVKYNGITEFEDRYPLAEIELVQDEPEFYTRWTTDIQVYPIPASGKFTLRYGKYPRELSQVSPTPEIPYDELIIATTVLVGAEELMYHIDLMKNFNYYQQQRFQEAITADQDDQVDWTPSMKGFTAGQQV